jgi:hypothetical protein
MGMARHPDGSEEAALKLRNRRFLAPEARRIVAPGEALFAGPGVADKSGMSPERAIEKEFLSPLQGISVKLRPSRLAA